MSDPIIKTGPGGEYVTSINPRELAKMSAGEAAALSVGLGAVGRAMSKPKPPTTAQANANLLRDIAAAPAPSGIDALRLAIEALEVDRAAVEDVREALPAALAEIEALRASKPEPFDDRRTRQNAARVNDRVADALDLLLARVDAIANCKNQGDLCIKLVNDLCDVWRCR